MLASMMVTARELVVLSGSVTSEIETGTTLYHDSPIHEGYTVESQVLPTNIPCLP